MGLDNRDYARDGRYTASVSGGGLGIPGVPSVCKALIGANVAMFLLQFLITRPVTLPGGAELPPALARQIPRESVVESWFRLETEKVVGSGQVWRLLTCAFLHSRGDIWHIVFNMLFLFWFGRTLERMVGGREFLLFYLVSAVIASVAHIGLDLVTGDRTAAIGASGAVMGVTMLYAIHFPRDKILLFFIIPLEIRWLVVLYVIIDLSPVLLALSGRPDESGVGHAAHLGGLAFGFIYWKSGLRLERLLPQRSPGPRPVPRGWSLLESPDPDPDPLDDRVDAILEKISREGEASLTDAEREILRDASRRRR